MAIGKYNEWRTPDGLTLIRGWARNGLSNEQIAHNIGITFQTLYDWIKKYSDIAEAIKKTKEVVDIEVENALHKRAMGYTYEEITRERQLNKETGEYELVITKKVTKHMPADVTAQIFWLKNRKPSDWRDRREQQVDIDGPETGVLMLAPVMKDDAAYQ